MDITPISNPFVSDAPLATCNLCHRSPVTSRGYSSCQNCRDKRNASKRRATARKREQKMRVFQLATRVNVPPSHSVEPTKPLKRKTPDGENEGDALERIRKRFKKMEPFKKHESIFQIPSAIPTTESQYQKFISASDLHKAIKQSYPDNANPLRFHGTYAIITELDPDHKLKAREVARNLRHNTSLQFNLDDREAYRSDDGAYTIHYKCTCHQSVKRTSSDLTSYFMSKNKAALATPKTECLGRIEVRAEKDMSHRLGWPGQRIKVTITHPKKL
ncbi:hypothetical protein R3P38DRAFT_3308647 [Favolaschia claudopus]|uniref:Uncharacterized protein n=1 Tax=Favolaschia claudopus TaxID=2862362 RepID=A0AAW0CXS7_9AGAR